MSWWRVDFFFSSRRRHTRSKRDWSSDVCSSDLVRHLVKEERNQFTIEAMSTEAVTTSEIEGEILDRASVQSSLRKQLGLATDERRVRPAERGIAEMMVELYRSFADPLSEEMLFHWHRMTMSGSRNLRDVGRYRTG